MNTSKTDCLIVGGGPIGLSLALFLAQKGKSSRILESKDGPSSYSRAIGISPVSLSLLATIGLDRDFVKHGKTIQKVYIHGGRGPQHTVGTVGFKRIGGDHPYILSIPQEITEKLLWDEVLKNELITLEASTSYVSFEEGDGTYRITAQRNGESKRYEALNLIGCDGIKSLVQEHIGQSITYKQYKHTFVMGDFDDPGRYQTKAGEIEGFGEHAHLFFTPQGAIESFPLPNKKRRWIVQTEGFVKDPPKDLVQGIIFERTGIDLRSLNPSWLSPFGIKRGIVSSFFKGRIYLAGDAAHIISPIGGQGMNLGFEDAFHLAQIVDQDNKDLKTEYTRIRSKAFNKAANQTEIGMALGTVRGPIRHFFRLIGLWLFLNGPYRFRLPFDYAMLTLPRKKKVL